MPSLWVSFPASWGLLEWTGPAGSARLVLVQLGWELVWVEPRRMWGWEQRWEGPDVSGRLSCLQKSCE